jgi:hypothetical protein
LARFVVHYPEFQVHYPDDASKKETDAINKKILDNAKKRLNTYAKKYYTKYADKGPVYKLVFKHVMHMVEKKMTEMYKEQLDKGMMELMGSVLDPTCDVAKWLTNKAIAAVEKKKSNKVYGQQYISALLEDCAHVVNTAPAQAPEQAAASKTKRAQSRDVPKANRAIIEQLLYVMPGQKPQKNRMKTFLANLRRLYYLGPNNVLKMTEQQYKNRQMILVNSVRKSIYSITFIHKNNDVLIGKIVQEFRGALDLDENNIPMDGKKAKKLQAYLGKSVTLDQINERIAHSIDANLDEEGESIRLGLQHLKYIYCNLMSNYRYLYEVQSIVEHLKSLKNTSVGYIEPPSKEAKNKLIQSMIAMSM